MGGTAVGRAHDGAQVREEDGAVVGEEDVAVVRAAYAAFARGDLAGLAALVTEDVTISQSPALPWGGERVGLEGLGRFARALTEHVDSAPVTERIYADGAGAVVQVGRTQGTVRATGASYDVAEVHVWRVRDGRISRFEAYVDAAAMLRVLAAPAP
ncbi:nuclear transport factor 2 family protein [Kineococcus glutinatus]|uniref:SnoaL-like domain-containing protein n=1 Tax=Kineococcus glutinatus TaxID=1070872 RepID=A0ABP9HD17_9ACTN